MNIVCSTPIAKNFERVKEFKMDLGFSLTQDASMGGKSSMRTIFKIRDPFVRHYQGLYECFVNKHGNIGSIGIYIDPSISNYEFKLFENDEEFSIPFDPGIENVRQYLSNVIGEIESGRLTSKNVEVSTDGSIEFYVDPNLPQEEYMEEFLKQRQRMEDMNILKK